MYSTLQVLTPPLTGPVPVELARKHLRVDHLDDDDLIEMQLGVATAWVEAYLGRTLVTTQLRWTIARDYPPLQTPYVTAPLSLLVLPQWFQWPLLDRMSSLELPREPVISVDAVSYGQWGGTDTVLTAGTDFDSDVSSGRLRIRPASRVWPNDHLAVDFTSGYGPDGTTVPRPIAQAVLLLTAHLYEHRGDAVQEPPPAAFFLLHPYRLITFG